MTKSDKILNIGCGNSKLSEDLSEEGYEDITNTDFSTKVITIMEQTYKEKFPKMKFKVVDVLDMKEFQTGTFNTVLDKGTLDCILCGDCSVPNAAKMMAEVFRVLAPGGHYMVITYGDPEYRKKYLETQPWASLTVDKLAKPSAAVSSTINADENDLKNFHYIYTMAKPK